MEMYLIVLPIALFTLSVIAAILTFVLTQRSKNKILRRMNRRRADDAWKRQEEIWQRLFAKADNTERLTQEILTRLAPRDSVH
jgi:(p)ppGpp synthase/HD superfamily hydrolase